MKKKVLDMFLAASVRRAAGIGAVCAGLLAAVPAWAQEDQPSESHLQAARAAITAIHATDRFDNILPAAAVALKSELLGKNPDQEALINQTVDEKTLAMAARRGDLEKEAALTYAKAFSEEELNSIAEFFNGPTGKKFMETNPQVTATLFRAAEIWQRGVVRDLAQTVSETLNAKIPAGPANNAEAQPAPAPAEPKKN